MIVTYTKFMNSNEHYNLRSGLTIRAFLLAIGATVMMSFWTQHSELVIDSPSFNSIHPSVAGFFAVICISLFINPLLKAIRPKWALTQVEMLFIYAILIVTGPVVSIGGVHFFLPTLIAPYYYATPENEYAELFHRYIPPWFGPKNPEVIRQFYESSEGAGVPWEAWIKPLLIWTPFLLAIYFIFLCMNVILRKQWIDREKLVFPLVPLPLEMTRDAEAGHRFNAFFRNGLMWIGFAIPVIIHGINGLHTYIPSFPSIQYKHINISRYFTEKPFNAMGYTAISFFPCIIGFAYILTVDVSFSCGFFYIFSRVESILGAVVGWTGKGSSSLAQFPFIEHQGAGAFIAITIISLVVSRRYIWAVLRKAFSPKSGLDDSLEPMSYRWAVLGLAGGILFLTIWCLLAGMTLTIVLSFLCLFCLFSVALTRIRVQAGMGCVHGPLTPQDLILATGGTVGVGAENLTILSHFHFFTGEMRGIISVMPSQLEGFKLAETVKINSRQLVLAIMLGTVIGLVLAYYAALRTIYDFGGNILNNWRVRSMPHVPFQGLRAALSRPQDPDWIGLQFVGFGFLFTLFLTIMRLRFLWWIFHPIGYAAAYTGRTIHWVWFPMLLGCLVKYAVLKHGGARTYRNFLPFFLGLILGDFFMGGFWGIIGLFSNQPGYLFFP